MIRNPSVAGRFYPADPVELKRQVREYTASEGKVRAAQGCVVPHAGYMYSGHVAGAVYSRLELPTRLILTGPRHYPRGEPLAILSEGAWETPLGNAKLDAPLAAELKKACPHLREDEVAHRYEHSLEVQLPFLQELLPNFTFVPIVLGTDHYPALEELGEAVASVVAAQKEPVMVIASSDMNHYESDTVTRKKDQFAIDRMLALDPLGLYDTVRSRGVTMCGYAAAVVMLVAAKALGATRAELVRYATSGDINGDRDSVVGYAGLTVH